MTERKFVTKSGSGRGRWYCHNYLCLWNEDQWQIVSNKDALEDGTATYLFLHLCNDSESVNILTAFTFILVWCKHSHIPHSSNACTHSHTNMQLHTHTNMQLHIHTQTCKCTHTHSHTNMQLHRHTNMQLHTHTNMQLHTRNCTHSHKHAIAHTQTCNCTHTNMQLHTHNMQLPTHTACKCTHTHTNMQLHTLTQTCNCTHSHKHATTHTHSHKHATAHTHTQHATAHTNMQLQVDADKTNMEYLWYPQQDWMMCLGLKCHYLL